VEGEVVKEDVEGDNSFRRSKRVKMQIIMIGNWW
jgi:hypothetical protein